MNCEPASRGGLLRALRRMAGGLEREEIFHRIGNNAEKTRASNRRSASGLFSTSQIVSGVIILSKMFSTNRKN